MLLRARCLSRGYSGVRPEVVDAYFEFLNRGITPDCFRYGSIGASGDLVPLATIAAAVVGEDVKVRFRRPHDPRAIAAERARDGAAADPGARRLGAHQRHLVHEQHRRAGAARPVEPVRFDAVASIAMALESTAGDRGRLPSDRSRAEGPPRRARGRRAHSLVLGAAAA